MWHVCSIEWNPPAQSWCTGWLYVCRCCNEVNYHPTSSRAEARELPFIQDMKGREEGNSTLCIRERVCACVCMYVCVCMRVTDKAKV